MVAVNRTFQKVLRPGSKGKQWTETIALGANRLLDPHRAPAGLANAVERMLVAPARWDRNEYGTGQAAAEIVAGIEHAIGNA